LSHDYPLRPLFDAIVSSACCSFLQIAVHLPIRFHPKHLQQNSDEVRNGREFALMAGFPPNDLIGSIDSSIDESKLSKQVVTVRWKE